MNPFADKFSHTFKVAIDTLFIKNPTGTSLGVLLGIIIQGILSLIEKIYLLKYNFISEKYGVIYTISFGIFIFNIKPYFTRNKISPQIIEAVDFIEDQYKQGRISKIEKKTYFRQLINQTVKNVTLDKETETQISNVYDIINKN